MIMIDIDMPDNCDECRFNTEYGFCKAMPDNFCGNTDDRKRPEWCPLKELETPILTIDEAVSELMDRHYKRLKEKGTVKPFHKCIGKDYSLIEDSHYDFCPYCGERIEWE